MYNTKKIFYCQTLFIQIRFKKKIRNFFETLLNLKLKIKKYKFIL